MGLSLCKPQSMQRFTAEMEYQMWSSSLSFKSCSWFVFCCCFILNLSFMFTTVIIVCTMLISYTCDSLSSIICNCHVCKYTHSLLPSFISVAPFPWDFWWKGLYIVSCWYIGHDCVLPDRLVSQNFIKGFIITFLLVPVLICGSVNIPLTPYVWITSYTTVF